MKVTIFPLVFRYVIKNGFHHTVEKRFFSKKHFVYIFSKLKLEDKKNLHYLFDTCMCPSPIILLDLSSNGWSWFSSTSDMHTHTYYVHARWTTI